MGELQEGDKGKENVKETECAPVWDGASLSCACGLVEIQSDVLPTTAVPLLCVLLQQHFDKISETGIG